jgi:hypothetical protein
VQLTCGAARLFASRGAAATAPAAPPPLSLPDGRLNVGTHLPLLSRRYRYLATLGEGASETALLAEDVFRPGRVVCVKALRRQHAAVGAREARVLDFLHGCAPGGAAPGLVRLKGVFFALGGDVCLVLERLHRACSTGSRSAPPRRPPPPRGRCANSPRNSSPRSIFATPRASWQNGDFRPENVLLAAPAGAPGLGARLADLGSAFSVTEADAGRVGGAEVGTLLYSHPRRRSGCRQGRASTPGARASCWSRRCSRGRSSPPARRSS